MSSFLRRAKRAEVNKATVFVPKSVVVKQTQHPHAKLKTGMVASSGSSASPAPPFTGKSQADFRAMMMKKK